MNTIKYHTERKQLGPNLAAEILSKYRPHYWEFDGNPFEVSPTEPAPLVPIRATIEKEWLDYWTNVLGGFYDELLTDGNTPLSIALKHADDFFLELADENNMARHEFENMLRDALGLDPAYSSLEWYKLDQADRALMSAHGSIWEAQKIMKDLGLHDAVAHLDTALIATSGFTVKEFAGLEDKRNPHFTD